MEICERVGLESSASRGEAGQDRVGSSAVVAAEEQPALPSDGDSLQASPGRAVVDLQVAVLGVADQGPVVVLVPTYARVKKYAPPTDTCSQAPKMGLSMSTVPEPRRTALCARIVNERPRTKDTGASKENLSIRLGCDAGRAPKLELRVLRMENWQTAKIYNPNRRMSVGWLLSLESPQGQTAEVRSERIRKTQTVGGVRQICSYSWVSNLHLTRCARRSYNRF